MGSISTGIGLISGIDTASLIESLITLESRGKITLQQQIASLQTQQTALLDVNARLLNLKSAAQAFRNDRIFRSSLATSSNDEVVTATASAGAAAGSYQFIVRQLVSTSQHLSRGYIDRATTPLGLSSLSFELGRGGVAPDVELADLNGGNGVARGRVVITDRAGASATVDLTDVATLSEVLGRINSNGTAAVTASVDGDHLVITDTSGGSGTLTVANAAGDTTATDLGIAASIAGAELAGTDINFVGAATALSRLNDGNGVLIKDNTPDLRIQARDGTIFDVDLGRVNASIESTSLLADLNDGAGVTISSDDENADITFVARDGTSYEVNLTGITTVAGLIDRVANATDGHIAISIHAAGDRFTVTDTVGGTGPLRITGAGSNGDDTAEDLGLLNDSGTAADSYSGEAVPNAVSLARATTIEDVIERINDAEDNAGRVTAAIGADGVSLQLTDNTGGGGAFAVLDGPANTHAASGLGIATSVSASVINGERLIAGLQSVLARNLNGGDGILVGGDATLTGSTLLSSLFQGQGISTNGDDGSPDVFVQDRSGDTYEFELDGLTTVQELIDAFDSATGGKVTLSINGQALEVTHNGGAGPDNFIVRDVNGSTAITELGISADNTVPDGDTVTGSDTDPTTDTLLQITNRAGATTEIDLSGVKSLQDVINLINDSGAAVTASVNAAGNGLAITDGSGGGGNLVISGNGAVLLGLSADVAASSVQGSNLQHGYVSNATALDDLNYGRGIGLGSFRITDGLGESAVVDIGSDSLTLNDIIEEINSKGLAVTARINDTGDGLLIEADLEVGEDPFLAIEVEAVSGSTARDLNILGTASSVSDGFIDGSYERQVDVTLSDSLEDIAEKINDAGIPVTAAIIDTGTGAARYRLNLTSGVSGRLGEMIVDTGGVDLGLTALSRGRDARVFFGADDPEDAFLLTSSTNSLTGVVEGVTIDLLKADDEAVTVNVQRDSAAIVESVSQFVTTINDVITVIDQYDFYNTDTERRGALLGSPITARIRQSMHRSVQQAAEGVGTSLRFLSQVGITIGTDGLLSFDKAKFEEAMADDPAAVEALFATFESTTASDEEIADGVSVPADGATVTARGFGDLFRELAESLTNTVDGTLTVANRGYDDRIELLEERVEIFDQRLEAKRARLQAQFNAMELALANLQNQSGALTSLAGNLALATAQRQ